jgi:hypothetical protein
LRIEEYFSMMIFIKQKLPAINAYDFLSNSGFWNPQCFITHSFKLCAENKLDSRLIEDLLSYVNRYLLINSINCWNYREVVLSVLDTIVNCCDEYEHIIKKQIDDEMMKKMLHRFVENNKFDCTESCFWIKKQENVILYNNTLNLIFEKLQKLADVDIIDLSNIGTIQEFQVYQ